MKMRRLLYLLSFIAVFSCCIVISTVQAQSQPERRRRPLGVALSGGGALGLAHIGVIRYFEEHHIPIDDIAGTSMGGLVGGLYAAGMDSVQLTDVVEHSDWNALLSSIPRFIEQPIVEKQHWNRTFGDLALRFGKKFSLPVGLNPGESLSLALSRDTLAYSDETDFDELPTPFRCVATDLVSGNAVVLGRGSLAKAMRATMSIPAIFTPVRWDDMVLVDGGILENIPVEVVRDMGAQLVIAVALETPKAKPEQFKSVADVLRQSVSIAIAQNERRSLALADIVISVDTTRFSGTDYEKWKEIIQAGYEAAQGKAQELAYLQLSDEEWTEFVRLRKARIRHAGREGAVVAVSAANPSFQQKAQSELKREVDDRVISEQKLQQVLAGMVAATAVPSASYGWVRTAQGTEGYKVEFSQRLGDVVLAKPSFIYAYSPGEPSRFAVQLSTTIVPGDAYKERFLGTATIGYDPGIRTEYYYPFGGSSYFIAADAFVERNHFISYEGVLRNVDTRDRFGGAFYGGIGTWRFAQLRLGMQVGYDSYSVPLTADGVRAESGPFAAPELRWIYNSQDSGGLPTRGTRSEGSLGYSFRQTSYPYLRNDFSTFYSPARRLSLFGINQIESSFGAKLNFYEQFTAGGQNQLSAFRYQEFHANTVLTGGGGLILRGPSFPSVSLYPALAIWYEAGRLDLGSLGWQTHQSTSTGIFIPTRVGAAGIAVSFDESGKARFRLMLGRL
jgi:NTE family protein